MSTNIKVNMKPVSTITARLGVGQDGDVQRYVTSEIDRRISRYMPYRTGVLSTKLKRIKSDTEIFVEGPYARYQYYGKAMDGAPPMVATDRDLKYDKSKNPQAGPLWDRKLMSAEGAQIAADVQEYVDKKRATK